MGPQQSRELPDLRGPHARRLQRPRQLRHGSGAQNGSTSAGCRAVGRVREASTGGGVLNVISRRGGHRTATQLHLEGAFKCRGSVT